MNLKNRKRLTDLETEFMVSGGKGQLGTLGRSWTLLCLKWITNKDLLHSTWNSSQCYMPVWMGGGLGENGGCVCVSLCWGFGGECVCVCVCVCPFAVHLTLQRVDGRWVWGRMGVCVCVSLCCSPDTTKGLCVCMCVSPSAVHLTLQRVCVRVCVCVSESLCCSPDTTTILLVSYTPIHNKRFKLLKISTDKVSANMSL